MKTLYTNLYYSTFKKSFDATKHLTLFSALLLSNPVLAEITIDRSDLPLSTVSKVTVTANRLPTLTQNTIAQTRIIDKNDLKKYQGQSVYEVIKNQPGFSAFSYGGKGTAGNFYVRGFDNSGILVLIDGVRYSQLSAGGASLSLVPIDQVDRIEVVYGASGSSIYGSDAMGGVIQIFTKGYNVDRTNASITAGVGSNDHYQYALTGQFLSDYGTKLSLSASRNETDGISTVAPGGLGYNKDNDGFESDNYSLKLDQKINDTLSIGISGLYADSTTQIDSTDDWQSGAKALDNAYADQDNGAANAYINFNTNRLNAKLSYGYSIDESATYETVANLGNPSEYNTKQQQINLTGNYDLPVGQAVYGLEHLTQKLDSNVYSADDRKVKSGFVGYVYSLNNIDAQANVRYDDYSDSDGETTYNLGAALRLNPEFRVGASLAKGYRVPTFNALYGPSTWGSNPNLKPETSDNYEAFIEYDTPLVATRITAYNNKVKDLITSDGISTAQYPYGQNINVNESKIKGISLTSDWFLDSYLVGFNYDYQEAKDDSGKANHDNFLPIRPKHKGLVYVGYQLPDVNIRAEYQYIDDYYYNTSNSTQVDGYSLVNLSSNFDITPNLSMTARINNLLNKDYETSPGYNTDGINFLASLTYKLN